MEALQQESSSSWGLSKVINLEVNLNKIKHGNGASSSWNKTEKKNVHNFGQVCFALVVVSAIYPV